MYIDITLILLGAVAILALAAIIFKPKIFVCLCLLYMPFEEFLLKWVPANVYESLRFGIEGLMYVVLASVILQRLVDPNRTHPKLKPLLAPLGIFIVASILSILINGTDWLIALLGFRWILRYLVFFFIVALLPWSEKEIIRLTHSLIAVALIQTLIGFGQVIIGAPLNELLQPVSVQLGEWNVADIYAGGSESRAVFGTMGRYNELGIFLNFWFLMAFSIWLHSRSRKMGLICLLIGVGLMLTYSRQAVFAAIVCATGIYFFVRKPSWIFLIVIPTVSLTGLAVFDIFSGAEIGSVGSTNASMVERFLAPFTPGYWDIDFSGKGRSYLMFEVSSILLSTSPLIGHGIGSFGTRGAILLGSTVYRDLGINEAFSMDVYWISILGQVGLLGLASLVWTYFTLGLMAWRNYYNTFNNLQKALIAGYIACLVSVTIESFFGSNFSDRYLALYIWTWGGLLASLTLLPHPTPESVPNVSTSSD